MKISESDVRLSSEHLTRRQYSVQESLRIWSAARAPKSDGLRDQVHLSELAIEASSHPKRTSALKGLIDDALQLDPHLLMLKMLIESLMGRKLSPEQIKSMLDPTRGEKPPVTISPSSDPVTFGLEYTRRETEYEAEITIFSARGMVRTSDGREIGFQLDLAMAREYHSENSDELRLGAAVATDPLVINFQGTAAELSDLRFSFDLDADGHVEHIAFVGHGSGFLALDRNGDGVINDGRELFGPQSGDGFHELAGYDQDGNGWIDENDAVYDKLQVWSMDADGTDRLMKLKEAGVGAIALTRVATPFSVKDDTNALVGQVRSSGIFLLESGGVGSIQQIDLVA
jgi:hypothetical protein